MCPSYLDGDQAATGGPVIPVAPVRDGGRRSCPEGRRQMDAAKDKSGAHANVDADVGIAVQFSRSAEKAPAGLAAGLSKLNSMQALRKRRALSKPGRHARSRRRLEIHGMWTWTCRPLQSWSSLERR